MIKGIGIYSVIRMKMMSMKAALTPDSAKKGDAQRARGLCSLKSEWISQWIRYSIHAFNVTKTLRFVPLNFVYIRAMKAQNPTAKVQKSSRYIVISL